MPPFIDKLIDQDGPLLYYFGLLLLPLLMARMMPLPEQLNPLQWLAELAHSLAAKVQRNDRSPQQQVIAGMLAVMLLVLPFWVIAALLLYLAAYPWFFELLVMYICMQDLRLLKQASAIARTLQAGNKAEARQRLSPWVARDTEELSEAGIAKATMETVLTMPGYRVITTLLAFVLLGAPGALLLAMLWQMQLCWWPQDPRFRYFGLMLAAVNQWLFWIPTQIWRLSLALNGGLAALASQQAGNGVLKQYQSVLATAAVVLRNELGGPQKYRGQRVDAVKFNAGPLPSAMDIRRAVSLTRAALAFWSILLTAIPVIWVALRFFHTL